MRTRSILVYSLLLALSAGVAYSTPNIGDTIHDAYPALANGSLEYARLAALPKGTLLTCQSLTVTEEEFTKALVDYPEELQAMAAKHPFFILEAMTTMKLLELAARADAAKAGRDVSEMDDRTVVGQYMLGAIEPIKVTDAEAEEFFKANQMMFGQATLDIVKQEYVVPLALQEKQKTVMRRLSAELGKTVPIEISADWVAANAVISLDNALDRARLSGRPTLLEFTGEGCLPCLQMKPVISAVKKKYDGRLSVMVADFTKDEMLAMRHEVNVTPTQILFDKDGREFFRHEGFYPQDILERKLAEMKLE